MTEIKDFGQFGAVAKKPTPVQDNDYENSSWSRSTEKRYVRSLPLKALHHNDAPLFSLPQETFGCKVGENLGSIR
jgi:hypothetical protein